MCHPHLHEAEQPWLSIKDFKIWLTSIQAHNEILKGTTLDHFRTNWKVLQGLCLYLSTFIVLIAHEVLGWERMELSGPQSSLG